MYEHFAKLAEEKATVEDAWIALFADYCKTYPEMKELWDSCHNTDNANHHGFGNCHHLRGDHNR